MLREERQLASCAALNSLPLGPPIRHCIEVSLVEFCEFFIKVLFTREEALGIVGLEFNKDDCF
jgi:hypothetical protein